MRAASGLPIALFLLMYAFGYGYHTSVPFSRMLERSDKNKDGVITPDEYGGVNVLRAAGRYIGNADGILTEAEWGSGTIMFGESPVLSLSISLTRLRLPNHLCCGDSTKGFESVIPSPLLHQEILYSVRNGGILTAFDVKTGEVIKTGRIQGAMGGYSASPVLAEGRLYFAAKRKKSPWSGRGANGN